MTSNRLAIVLLSGICLSLSIAAEASAQRRGGRGSFGVSRVQLASLDTVQAALKLSDEQKKAAEDISQKLNDDRRELFQGSGGDRDAMREKMQEMNQKANAELAEKLEEGQRKRLMEIYVQLNGANALIDDEVAKTLELSEDQQKALATAQDENRRARSQAFQNFREMSDEERREAFGKFREESDERMMGPLSDAQREQFASLKGEEIEIDMRQLFRGRRQGADGGRRRPSRPESE